MGRKPSAKTCTIEGCDRRHEAKGMCHKHYVQTLEPKPRKTITIPCVECGKLCEKEPARLNRYPKQYCSPRCKADGENGDRWIAEGASCRLPTDHWARWYGKSSPWSPPPQRHCEWCGDEFTSIQPSAIYCASACKSKAGKARRRAREHAAPGTYTWTEVTKLWIQIGRCCAYCAQPTTYFEPDHVVPLSRGGSNSITNIAPACQQCNGDKRDLSLTEWYEDRERRKLPSRRLSPLLTHLTHALLAA